MAEWKTTYAEKLAYGTMGADWQDRINWERLRYDRTAKGFGLNISLEVPEEGPIVVS